MAHKLFTAIPIILISALLNSLIAATMACVAGLLAIEKGYSKQSSLVLAILVAIVITCYLYLLPKIKSYLTRSDE